MSVPWYLMAKGKGGGGYKTASGPIVSVSDAIATPLRSLVANIDPVQDLHGYDSPWPAGGGKNKLNPLSTYKGVGYNPAVGTTLNPVAADKSWQDAGNDTFTISNLGSWAQACLISDPLPLGKASVKISNVRGSVKGGVYVCNGDFKVNRISYILNPVEEGGTIQVNTTFVNDDTYFVVYLGGSGSDVSIQYPYAYSGDTASTDSYAPYSNECPISGWSAVNVWVEPTYDPTANPTATLQLGQTVYGGTLDVTNGVLTVDRAKVVFDGSEDESWNEYLDYNGYYRTVRNMRIGNRQDGISNMLVNSKSSSGVPDNAMWLGVNSRNFFVLNVYETMGATLSAFKAYLAAHPLEVVIPLATPITIPLTPTQISTLQGQNNVWADSGDVTVDYLASGGANADLMKLAVAFMGRKC